jgi:phosphoglycolate phosphatase
MVLLFDFDGTIANNLTSIQRICNDLSLKYRKIPLSQNEFDMLREKPTTELLNLFRIPYHKLPFIVRSIRERLSHDIPLMQSFPELPAILHTLSKNRITMGIVSSNSQKNIKTFLSNHSLELFSFIHSENSLVGKSRIISRILRQNNLNRSEVIYVGDEIRDIEAAHKTGIKAAAVFWGFNTKKALQSAQPDFLISTPKELLSLC